MECLEFDYAGKALRRDQILTHVLEHPQQPQAKPRQLHLTVRSARLDIFLCMPRRTGACHLIWHIWSYHPSLLKTRSTFILFTKVFARARPW